MAPPLMKKQNSTNPTTRNIEEELRVELPNPEDEDLQVYDDEDLQEVDTKEPVIPMNNRKQEEVSKAQIELELELKIRKLCEIETQLINRKIALKNPESLTGVYSEQEMISLAQRAKFEIQVLIDYIKKTFKYENSYFIDKFNEIEKGIKTYEYWVISDKKSK